MKVYVCRMPTWTLLGLGAAAISLSTFLACASQQSRIVENPGEVENPRQSDPPPMVNAPRAKPVAPANRCPDSIPQDVLEREISLHSGDWVEAPPPPEGGGALFLQGKVGAADLSLVLRSNADEASAVVLRRARSGFCVVNTWGTSLEGTPCRKVDFERHQSGALFAEVDSQSRVPFGNEVDRTCHGRRARLVCALGSGRASPDRSGGKPETSVRKALSGYGFQESLENCFLA